MVLLYGYSVHSFISPTVFEGNMRYHTMHTFFLGGGTIGLLLADVLSRPICLSI